LQDTPENLPALPLDQATLPVGGRAVGDKTLASTSVSHFTLTPTVVKAWLQDRVTGESDGGGKGGMVTVEVRVETAVTMATVLTDEVSVEVTIEVTVVPDPLTVVV